jgi:hypothetical protein
MKTMAYRIVRRVHVAVHGTTSPSNEEWHAYLADIGRNISDVDAVFTTTQGGSLDAGQRDYAAKFWEKQARKLPIAVTTPSGFVRAVAGTLRFMFGGQIKAFSPEQRAEAFAYLGMGPDQQRAVTEAIAQLEKDLPGR